MTFSGGECMLYADFLASVARLCKEEEINVAIDTAGCVPFSEFEKVLPYADAFLYDIKALDEALHVKGTGKSNSLILENLERLIKTGKKITVRVPVILNVAVLASSSQLAYETATVFSASAVS